MSDSSSMNIPLYGSFISACSPNHTNVSLIIASAKVKSKNCHLCMDHLNTQNKRVVSSLFSISYGQTSFVFNEIIVNISINIGRQKDFFYADKTSDRTLLLSKAHYNFSF